MEGSLLHLFPVFFIYEPTCPHSRRRSMMKPSKMLNLTRPSNKDKHRTVIGRFKHDARCKRHPKHQQSPGVCSLCLRDKLSHISTSTSASRPPPPSSTAASSSVSSLSSYYSSSSASSCVSPAPHRLRFPTDGKTGSSFSVFFFNGAKHGLGKSRSMAVAPRRREADGEKHPDDIGNNKSTKKGWFLFNLLRPRNRRMEDKHSTWVHSGSLRENVAVAT